MRNLARPAAATASVASLPSPASPASPGHPAPSAAAPEPPTDRCTAADPDDMAAACYDPADYHWVPVLRRRRVDGWSAQRQQAFIEELADCGSVATAALNVGMSVSSAYKLRRSPDGHAFAAAWDSAIQQAASALVDAAFERAINGSEEPVFNRDGQRVGRRLRQSDALLMFLLRKHFPERYGDRHRDRSPYVAAPSVQPVARSLAALAPPQAADPATLLSADELEDALDLADICDGELAHFHRDDGRDPEARAADARAAEADRGALRHPPADDADDAG